MNVFKRKSIYLAVAAGLGAVGAAGSASAVTLSQTGTGEVLIYPYYTVRGGADAYNTYISVTNTTASAKAVKVRFLEGKNSREVLDFNLYLSPFDMWTAELSATATGTQLTTTDKSCSGLPSSGVAGFVNYAYGGTNTEQNAGVIPDPVLGKTGDFEDQTLDRTREGYFEIIEMGTITDATLITAVTHVNGTPANCAVANGLTVGAVNGQAYRSTTATLMEPTGGLEGNATLINVNAGTDFSFDPVALSAFANAPIWAISGSIRPDMTDVSPKSSTVFKSGFPVTSAWGVGSVSPVRAGAIGGSNADAVTAVLMHDRLMNDFALDTTTLTGTDWVVTMPTKRHYIGVDGASGSADTLTATPITPFTTSFYTGGACEEITLKYYNREEGTPSGSTVNLSPLPPGVQGDALCWESTVLTFEDSTGILGSSNSVTKDIDSATTTYMNGWMIMSFDGTDNNMIDATGTYTYRGLPAVGFMVQDFNNSTVTDSAGQNVLSVYGGSFVHKYRTNINGVTAE